MSMCICACVCVCVYKHIFSHRKPSNRNGFMIHVYCTCNKLLDSLYHNVVCIAIARAIDMVWYGQMESISSILNEWWCVHNEREKHKKKTKEMEKNEKWIEPQTYPIFVILSSKNVAWSCLLLSVSLFLSLSWNSSLDS